MILSSEILAGVRTECSNRERARFGKGWFGRVTPSRGATPFSRQPAPSKMGFFVSDDFVPSQVQVLAVSAAIIVPVSGSVPLHVKNCGRCESDGWLRSVCPLAPFS